jgi:threonine dehydratase
VITKPDVEAALRRIQPSVHETPLVSATRLGKRSGDVHLMLKCESMQRAGSLKARGARVVAVLTGGNVDTDRLKTLL